MLQCGCFAEMGSTCSQTSHYQTGVLISGYSVDRKMRVNTVIVISIMAEILYHRQSRVVRVEKRNI
jgi:hypothetical protein